MSDGARARTAGVLAAALVLLATVAPSLSPASGQSADAAPRTAATVWTSAGIERVGAVSRPDATIRPGSATWVSRGAARGAWIRWSPARAERVDHLRIVGAGAGVRMTSGVVSFSDGSRLAVRTDASGSVSRSFPARTVRWAKLTVTSSPSKQRRVALARFAVTRTQGAPVLAAQRLRPRATVIGGGAASALTDALSGGSGTGRAWEASASGRQRIRLAWSRPVEVAAVRLRGPSGGSGGASAGRLVFSDGSSVQLLPVAAGAAATTTVAFTPRVITSMTVELQPSGPGRLRLREITASGPGPIVRPASALGRSTPIARAQTCATATSSPTATLRLVCPATGTSVRGTARVVVSAPAGSRVTATAVLRTGASATVATASASRGTATLRVDTGRLPGGPVVLRVAAAGVARPLHVQLMNASRRPTAPPTASTAHGKRLVFADEFTRPASISGSGAGAAYAATKPASWGGSEFGEAVFSDPATHPANLSTVAGQYLRIRTTPLEAGERDATGWRRTSRGGILASASVPGGGFAAQYGYFEARILAPASPGTWPAFWMMSSGFLEDSQAGGNSEIDAVELYGQDPSYSCHSWHDWKGVAGRRAGNVDCVHHLPDWAMTWHTYGVDVAADATRYYIDGALVSTAPAVQHADEPFYFMLDLSLGAGWPIDLAGVRGVADLYVDWVHVYV